MEEFQLQKALCYLNYNASEDVVGGAQENAITFRRYKSFLKTDFWKTKFQKKKKKISTILAFPILHSSW